MGRARQIASAENMDRILLDASAASTDEGEHLLLDASAVDTDVGFFINTEIGTTETPPEGFVGSSSIAADAIDNTKIADDAIKREQISSDVDLDADRNVIINGGMFVAQRASSATGLGASSGYFTCDRWNLTAENTNGRLTMSQESPTDLPGFSHAIKLDCTTADTSIAAGEDLILSQSIEGYNLQHFKKGTSEARGWALSFYAKGDTTSTYAVELLDGNNTRHICSLFTIHSNWSRVKINFPADTTGALAVNANTMITLNFWLHAGSTYNGGTLQTTWAAKSNANRAVGADSFFASTDRNFHLTGVQLEPGDECTEFQYEPFEATMRKCQRYYHRVSPNNRNLGVASYYNGTTVITSVYFPVEMRAVPTITENLGTIGNQSFIVYRTSDADYVSSASIARADTSSCQIEIGNGNGTSGDSGVYSTQYSDQSMEFKADIS